MDGGGTVFVGVNVNVGVVEVRVQKHALPTTEIANIGYKRLTGAKGGVD